MSYMPYYSLIIVLCIIVPLSYAFWLHRKKKTFLANYETVDIPSTKIYSHMVEAVEWQKAADIATYNEQQEDAKIAKDFSQKNLQHSLSLAEQQLKITMFNNYQKVITGICLGLLCTTIVLMLPNSNFLFAVMIISMLTVMELSVFRLLYNKNRIDYWQKKDYDFFDQETTALFRQAKEHEYNVELYVDASRHINEQYSDSLTTGMFVHLDGSVEHVNPIILKERYCMCADIAVIELKRTKELFGQIHKIFYNQSRYKKFNSYVNIAIAFSLCLSLDSFILYFW